LIQISVTTEERRLTSQGTFCVLIQDFSKEKDEIGNVDVDSQLSSKDWRYSGLSRDKGGEGGKYIRRTER